MNTQYTPKSDLELKTLLASWQLEHLYNHCLEQKITLKVLKILQPKHVDKLFANRPVGDHAIFEHRLAIWKQLQLFDDPTPTAIPKANGNDPPTLAAFSRPKDDLLTPKPKEKSKNNTSSSVQNKEVNNKATYDDGDDDYEEEMDDDDDDEDWLEVRNKSKRLSIPRRSSSSKPGTTMPKFEAMTAIPSPMSSSVPPPSPYANSSDSGQMTYATTALGPRYNLRKILSESCDGQGIVRYYEQHKILKEEHRISLINCIARYIEGFGGILSLSEGTNLENQILEMFPTEKEEYYRTGKRGRLYNKMSNLRRACRRSKKHEEVLQSLASAPDTPDNLGNIQIKEEFIEEEQQTETVDFEEMRKTITSDEERMEFWKRHQLPRFKDTDAIEALQDILDKWPEYKLPNPREYISYDFKVKFPTATKFSEVFFKNLKKLEKVLFDKVYTSSATYKCLQQYNNCSKESKNLLILWALHQLIPPTHQVVVDDNGVRRKKRFSIQDSQNACFCIRDTLADIEQVLAARTTSTPPMLLVVGELIGDIDEVYVYFEEQRYRCQTVVEAVELCMELYFVFSIAFPEEAVLYYSFAQTFFLNIPSEVKNPRIFTTINDINACEI
ncbi:uncharacterized protein isoform X2 [Musca autumnalis]